MYSAKKNTGAAVTRPESVKTTVLKKTRAERLATNLANLRKGAETKVRRRNGLTPNQRQAIARELKSKKPTIWRMPFKRLTKAAMQASSNALIAEQKEGFDTCIKPYMISNINGKAQQRLHAFVQGELFRIGSMAYRYMQKSGRRQLTGSILNFIVSTMRLPQHPLVFADEKPVEPVAEEPQVKKSKNKSQ